MDAQANAHQGHMIQWPSVVFFGHSYIRRLGEFVSTNPSLMGDFGMQGMFQAPFTFGFEGLGGASVATLRAQAADLLNTYDPISVLVLHAGDNEVRSTTDYVVLAQDIVSLAEYLHVELRVRQVVISQLLYRDFTRGCDVWTHNETVRLVNKEVKCKVSALQNPHIVYWRHQGFGRPDVRAELMNEDGIHLNDKGHLKLYQSFKSALVQAMKRLFAEVSTYWEYSIQVLQDILPYT